MNIYDFTVTNSEGQQVNLATFKGKVILIINSATHCGYTKQYPDLEALYKKYKNQGFVILDFPCNQFAFQAPEEIGKYVEVCTLKHGVTFPIFAKIKVNGIHAEPLYKFLKSSSIGGHKRIRWNFTKFLIDRAGNVVGRYEPATLPSAIALDIERYL